MESFLCRHCCGIRVSDDSIRRIALLLAVGPMLNVPGLLGAAAQSLAGKCCPKNVDSDTPSARTGRSLRAGMGGRALQSAVNLWCVRRDV